MFVFNLPTADDYSDYCWFENFLSDDEIQHVMQIGQGGQWTQGAVTDGRETDVVPEARQSSYCPLRVDRENYWLFDKMAKLIAQCNQMKYQYDLAGFYEPLHLTEYRTGEFYQWHKDNGKGVVSTRKLSITIQLTDPAEYDGGNLELHVDRAPEAAPRERGTAIIFPSFTMHRVTAVTRGTRTALVGWVSGPAFR